MIVTELLHMLRLLLYHPNTFCQVFLLFSSVLPDIPLSSIRFIFLFCYILLHLFLLIDK